MQTVTTIGLDIAKSVFQVHSIEDPVRLARGLDTRRHVDRISPHVIDELARPATNAGENLTGEGWPQVSSVEQMRTGTWRKGICKGSRCLLRGQILPSETKIKRVTMTSQAHRRCRPLSTAESATPTNGAI